MTTTAPWPQILVVAPPERLEALEAALFDAGALSVTAEDAADTPIFEPAPGTTPLWQQTRLRALFARDAALAPLLDNLRARWPDLVFAGDTSLEERDWEREWLAHFRPLRFGRRLWVSPLHAPVTAPDAVVVRLDPGLAFGTGTHPSTASCLRWLDREAPFAAERVLDYGCGSGILAIAALKLGAARATATDIDGQALQASRANADVNGVGMRLATVGPQRLAAAGYDVILANILAGPLMALAPRLAALARPGARLKLAGILAGQADAVAAAYAPWFDVNSAPVDAEWAAVSGVRRSG